MSLNHSDTSIAIVAVGPGDPSLMTLQGREILENADVVAGFKTVLDVVQPWLTNAEACPMTYRDQEDVLRAFVNECGLMFKPELEIGAAELTETLAAWCKEEGRKAPKGLGEWLEENGCNKTQKRETTPEGEPTRPRYWEGIGFRKE